MGPSRSRTLSLIVFLFLAALSLRRWTAFEDWIERAIEPARTLGGLAAPLAWASAREVRAAEATFQAGEEARRAAARAVLVAAQTSAAPRDLVLARGRGLVHAEVVDRAAGDPDRAIIRFAPGSEIERGMPVVCGDFYVGRVVSIDRAHPGEAAVDLLTGKDFRVGAEIVPEASTPVGERALLVVGGVLPRGGGREREKGDDRTGLLLAVHCPSDRKVSAGLVRVCEIDPPGPPGPPRPSGSPGDDSFSGLANGFALGSLERAERGGAGILAVRPGLDYSAGLYQIAVVCPSQHAPAGPNLAQDPFAEDGWLEARLALAGDPAFWREGRIVRAGTAEGVETGAALAVGGSFLGRVIRAGRSTSQARLIGDAGLEFSAIADLAGKDPAGSEVQRAAAAPITVGLMVSLGRDRSNGELLLRWDAAIPLAPEGPGESPQGAGEPIPATLYTASGQRAVPPGLLVGTALLPRGPGPFLLRVHQEESGLGLGRVRVWRSLRSAVQEEGRVQRQAREGIRPQGDPP